MEDRKTVARPPDDEPVAGIGDVALVAAGPVSFERVHIVPLPQKAPRFVGVFRNEVDNLLEQAKVVVFLGQPLRILLELRGELNLQHR